MKVLRSLTAVILLACFLVAPASTLSMVLCVRADGHITLEAAHNGRCSSLFIPTGMLLQEAQHDSHTNHCGPCIDVPLLTSDTHARQFVLASPLVLQLETPGFTLVPWIILASPDVAFVPLFRSPPAAANTALSALSTVILLL
jgi:hypothetical protein